MQKCCEVQSCITIEQVGIVVGWLTIQFEDVEKVIILTMYVATDSKMFANWNVNVHHTRILFED